MTIIRFKRRKRSGSSNWQMSASGTYRTSMPTMSVSAFGVKRTSLIRAPMICHFWGSELLYVPPEPGTATPAPAWKPLR